MRCLWRLLVRSANQLPELNAGEIAQRQIKAANTRALIGGMSSMASSANDANVQIKSYQNIKEGLQNQRVQHNVQGNLNHNVNGRMRVNHY